MCTSRTRFASGMFLLFWFCSLSTAQVQVQPVSHDAASTFDGLLRNLTSQLNFHAGAPLVPNANTMVPSELQQARQLIATFAADAARLISALQIEQRYSDRVRLLLGDAALLKASADVLAQRSQSMSTIPQFAAEYAAVDAQWRPLDQQLKMLPDAGNRVLQETERIGATSKQLSKLLRLEPQMQRDELGYQFAALRAELDRLTEDIQVELYANPDRVELANRVRALQSRAAQLSAALDTSYAYRDVKRYYKQFFDDWTATKRMLRSLDNRYIQRSISRLGQTNNRLHELLWLAPVIDGADILYLADMLKKNVDYIGDQITLTRLVALPNSRQIFDKAQDFHALCDSFREHVANSTELESVSWEFRELDVAWNDLRNLIAPLRNETANQYVALIDGSIMELRDTMGQPSSLDPAESLQLVSELNNMTEMLYNDLKRYVGQSDRYPASFRSQAVNLANNLQNLAKSLYQSVSDRRSDSQVRQQAGELSNRWNELQQLLTKLPEPDRTSIARATQYIGPALAKLQILYY